MVTEDKELVTVTEEQKEIVVQSYRETYDKYMSYRKAGLSSGQIELLESDEGFQDRLLYFIIKQREEIISRYRDFMRSDNEQISFKATTDFAKLIYPDFFKNLSDKHDPKVIVNVNPNSDEEDDRILKEYGNVVGDKDHFKEEG